MLEDIFPQVATVRDTTDAWVIEMDMPGVERERVAVNAVGKTLEIRGERQKGERRVLYQEKFRLPDALASVEGVTAAMHLGVLTVTVPKGASRGVLSIPVN